MASGAARYSFVNDYSEGAHPRLLQVLAAMGPEQHPGYGLDRHTARARELILAQLRQPRAQVHFLVGGTQTNLVALSAFLRPHHAVIAASTGHIAVHEAGAIEATGHKVIAVPSEDGRLTPDAVRQAVRAHAGEHMVRPRLVYISNSTELGTIYGRAELEALRSVCDLHGLLLYLDGARLGSALTASGNDLSLADIAALVHAFYIGGTKNGALLGEALVIVDPALQPDFRYAMKQRGALLAKGGVVGAQFEALFEDGLFFDLAAHANAMANRLSEGVSAAGLSHLVDSATNQIFPILPDRLIDKLERHYAFMRWQSLDDAHSAIRLVTSWATPEWAVEAFVEHLRHSEAGR